MKNDNLKLKETIQKFHEYLGNSLSLLIDEDVLNPLTNMLALHYIEQDESEYETLAIKASRRLESYLGKRIVVEYDFSVLLGLFTIAISDYKPDKKDITENIHKSENKGAVQDQILHEFESGEELEGFSSFLEEIGSLSNNVDILNYVASNKKRTKEIFSKLSKIPNITGKDLNKEMLFAVIHEASIANRNELYKKSLSLAGVVVAGAAIAATCVMGLGMVAAVAIIPATAVGARFCAKPIELLTGTLSLKNDTLVVDSAIDKVAQQSQNQNQTRLIPTHQASINKSQAAEAGKILGQLGITDAKNIKIKKDHTPEVKAKAEAIKENINSRQV